jgi:hypothetical protein
MTGAHHHPEWPEQQMVTRQGEEWELLEAAYGEYMGSFFVVARR